MLNSNTSPFPSTQSKFLYQKEKKEEKKNNTAYCQRRNILNATSDFSTVPTKHKKILGIFAGLSGFSFHSIELSLKSLSVAAN